jgi:hypothetical protein
MIGQISLAASIMATIFQIVLVTMLLKWTQNIYETNNTKNNNILYTVRSLI